MIREYDDAGFPKGWSCLNELISIKSISSEDEGVLGEKVRALIIVDKLHLADEQNDENSNLTEYELKFHLASGDNTNDWKVVINDFIKKSNRQDNKYAINYLLWHLDKDWSVIALRSALYSYPSESASFVIDVIQKISKILSIDRQQLIQSLFINLRRNYSIHNHQIIYQAVEQIDYITLNVPPGAFSNVPLQRWSLSVRQS